MPNKRAGEVWDTLISNDSACEEDRTVRRRGRVGGREGGKGGGGGRERGGGREGER